MIIIILQEFSTMTSYITFSERRDQAKVRRKKKKNFIKKLTGLCKINGSCLGLTRNVQVILGFAKCLLFVNCTRLRYDLHVDFFSTSLWCTGEEKVGCRHIFSRSGSNIIPGLRQFFF